MATTQTQLVAAPVVAVEALLAAEAIENAGKLLEHTHSPT